MEAAEACDLYPGSKAIETILIHLTLLKFVRKDALESKKDASVALKL